MAFCTRTLGATALRFRTFSASSSTAARSSSHFAPAALAFAPLTAPSSPPPSAGSARYFSRGPSRRTSSFDLPDPRKSMSYDDDMGYDSQRRWSPQLAKIVATIGPASEQLPVMKDVVRCGMRVMRLNFSHATVEEVELRCDNLSQSNGRHSVLLDSGDSGAAEPTGESSSLKNVRAVLLDTRGPEIRTGKLAGDDSGKKTVSFDLGSAVLLHTSDEVRDGGSTASDLYVDYPGLRECLKPGMKVLLDDGAVVLTVVEVLPGGDGGAVACTADNSGEIRSRAGVNLPGAETDLPALSDKDKVDIKYGMSKDVDYVAASFVQNADGCRKIRAYMEQCVEELTAEGKWEAGRPLPLLISKIESASALTNFDEILDESDGIMVARGDLGVEIPIQQVANAQKEMVAACNAAGKPVIVATQMLESMTKNPRPTRAEVADVTNAIYDGADAVMLSGETAKGKYPVEAVKVMNEIIASAENFAKVSLPGPNLLARERFANNGTFGGKKSVESALARAAVAAAEEREATAILVLTSTGTLPRFVAAHRPHIPILAFCPTAKVARQLMLHRGVHPIHTDLGDGDEVERDAEAIAYAKKFGMIQSGEEVVVVTREITSDELNTKFGSMKLATVP